MFTAVLSLAVLLPAEVVLLPAAAVAAVVVVVLFPALRIDHSDHE